MFFRRTILAAAAAFVLSGPQPAYAQDTIVVGKTFLAAALDPARGNAGWALTSHGIGQNLFTVGRDGRVVPSLALDASPIDERSWTVRLRPDQRFSDGVAVTAAEVATGLNRTIAENPAARSAGTLSFEALDALTLKVSGDRPLPILPSTLAEWPFVVYRASERGPVFTGPWQVAAFEPDRELTLEPNRFHADAEQRPRIRLRRFGDGQALALAVQSGEVDLAFNVPVEALPRLRASAGVTVKSFAVSYQYMAWINTSRPLLGDVRVRRAIDLAIDRDLLIQAISGGVRATGAYATTFPFATREPRPFDRARAAALLDEAGWRLDGNVRRKDGQTLRLVLLAYPQRPDLVTMQPVLRAEFAKLGIEVETRVSDNAQAAAREGNFDLMLWAQHTAPAGDPAFFPSVFLRSGAANNHARFASPALDAVLDRFAAASDFETRMLIASEAERVVFAQAPVAYLLTPVWHVALSRRLAGYEPWGSDYYVLRADLRLAR